MYCFSNKVKRFGKTKQNKQRFRCNKCLKTFVWKERSNKRNKERCWFELWVKEGYSVRQLSRISGHSESKLKRIKNYWLVQQPPVLSNKLLKKAKYLLFDGTYFHKKGCLVLLIDIQKKQLLCFEYIEKESYPNVYPILMELRKRGLHPKVITLDGHKSVTQAIIEIWPSVTIQRCLFHIQRQGLMWIRLYPKTKAGRILRTILKLLMDIHSEEQMNSFLRTYHRWYRKYRAFIKTLPKDSVANKDLRRTMALINNALPNMFHFIKDQKVAHTTNFLEGFYSQLKHHYRSHQGLTEKHKIQYLKWYCYLKNGQN